MPPNKNLELTVGFFFFSPNFFVIEFLGKFSQTMRKISQIYNLKKEKIPNFFGKN
jgi:hypothetical protein